jgi:hypothetical protein
MPKMTVADLIAALVDFDPKAEVMLTSDYGDHCHTEQALEIEDVEEVALEKSGYSATGWAVPSDEEDEDDDEEEEAPRAKKRRTVVAIRSSRGYFL